MATSDMTPEQIEQINEYADAFRQEFEASQNATKSPKEQREDIHVELDEILPDALATIKTVIRHSVNENLRASTAKWLIDKKLERDKDENDPLAKLLEDMKKSLPGNPEPITEQEYRAATEDAA